MILKLPKSSLKKDFDIDKLLEHNCGHKHGYLENKDEDDPKSNGGQSPENRIEYLLDIAEEYDTGETASYLDIRASHRIVHKKDVKEDADSEDEEIEYKDGVPMSFNPKFSEWEVIDSAALRMAFKSIEQDKERLTTFVGNSSK